MYENKYDTDPSSTISRDYQLFFFNVTSSNSLKNYFKRSSKSTSIFPVADFLNRISSDGLLLWWLMFESDGSRRTKWKKNSSSLWTKNLLKQIIYRSTWRSSIACFSKLLLFRGAIIWSLVYLCHWRVQNAFLSLTLNWIYNFIRQYSRTAV